LKLNIKQGSQLKLKNTHRLAFRIRLSGLLMLKEDRFAEVIKDLEGEPLFERLMYSRNRSERILHFKKFPFTALSRNFYELNEKLAADSGSFDMQSFLSGKQEVMGAIKRLGRDKFERYFLYNTGGLSLEEIASECALKEQDAKRINGFINEVSIHGEFLGPGTADYGSRINYTRIAAIEKGGENEFIINMFSPQFVRGKYVVDYERLEALKKQGAFSPEELKKIRRLIEKLETVNIRKSVIYQVIKSILRKQSAYFRTGLLAELRPFAQKELAAGLAVDESSVSRAVYGRSLVTPESGEKPLGFFLPSRKDIRKNLIRDIIDGERAALTDSAIRDRLRETSGISVSRRSVADCRKELGIETVFKRRKSGE
jgi:DNA-directed RNA polymerase specialized sigma54-like protein